MFLVKIASSDVNIFFYKFAELAPKPILLTTSKKLEIFNDPIYGFITIPTPLIFELISHPYFQRLRRISQMGLSYLVFPGAHHTRFHHALGAMHLMQKAVQLLRNKSVEITDEEEEGLLTAILLHDIGHGPFSHAMEHSIVEDVHHETISLLFMEDLNAKFNGSLTTAISIFKKEHPKTFLNQLVSSQLDMDRMDYLKRDSFYTGVSEGNINSERLITMLNVVDRILVVEEKGIYSVEKFLMARRFMYWQVYLHKTGLVAEQLLIRSLKRAKELLHAGTEISCSDNLMFFLKNKISRSDFNTAILHRFSLLDDTDLMAALKQWREHSDVVLSSLCEMLLDRKLLHIKVKNKPISQEKVKAQLEQVKLKKGLSDAEAAYFVFSGDVRVKAYESENQKINILKSSGKLIDLTKASDHLNLKALSKTVTKYYMCFPKDSV